MGLVILCRRSTSGCPRVGLGVNGSMEIASPDHCLEISMEIPSVGVW